MYFPHHPQIGAAANITVPDAVPVLSYSPVVVPIAGRPADLQMRVSAPAPITGAADDDDSLLPVIVLAHGAGSTNSLSSLEGYGPIADFWAGHGFVVVQPTLLYSTTLDVDGPGAADGWYRESAADLSHVLDHLDDIERSVPLLGGRLDREKIAVAGHSMGAWVAALTLGLGNVDPRSNGTDVFAARDDRFKAGLILSGMGLGGDAISEQGRTLIPAYGPDFSTLTTPSLVVYGDRDVQPYLTTRGADWHADPYVHSPGATDLLTVGGGGHLLGGIAGWDAAETDDESPERLVAVERMTWAYLWSSLHGDDDDAWSAAVEALGDFPEIGSVQHKE